MAATIIRGPEEGNWAPGYYYVLFEDPDGIQLEVCFVPGAGLLAAGTSFDLFPRAILRSGLAACDIGLERTEESEPPDQPAHRAR